MAAQHLGADGMKGAEPAHPLDHAANERADAVFHFTRRLVGEGDRKDPPRRRLVRRENMGKAGGEHARLAGPRARQHQHGAVDAEHRLALFGVEADQIRRLARNRRGLWFLAERGVERIGIGHKTIVERHLTGTQAFSGLWLFIESVAFDRGFIFLGARLGKLARPIGRAMRDSIGPRPF